jgi:hypothetical protein
VLQDGRQVPFAMKRYRLAPSASRTNRTTAMILEGRTWSSKVTGSRYEYLYQLVLASYSHRDSYGRFYPSPHERMRNLIIVVPARALCLLPWLRIRLSIVVPTDWQPLQISRAWSQSSAPCIAQLYSVLVYVTRSIRPRRPTMV